MYIAFILLYTSLNGVNSVTINDAKLTGGSSGTLEVLTQRGWQNLCVHYFWGSSESKVLCRQLGYSSYSYTGYTSITSTAQSSVLLFNHFSCSGNETSISECSFDFLNERSWCTSIVHVTCTPCVDGSVQLSGGVVLEAGTVEYCARGTWKAVCDTNWYYMEAFVVCRELGFPATDAVAYSNSYFGDHSLSVSDTFYCIGDEFSLSNCPNVTTTCNFANTAGVHCKGDVISDLCIDGHVRLVRGKDENEGRVEICSNGVWGSIYSEGWDSRDARVICRQLGLYQPYSRIEVYHNGYFGAGTGPILYAFLDCNGDEISLDQCSSSSYYINYDHSSDAGVRCNKVTTATRSRCSDGDARLMNGTSISDGRVEICYDGVWGSVCDFGWNDQDAAIVCLQLNFQATNATALTGSYFGNGTGPYHLSNVNCIGVESTLLECSHNYSTIGTHACAGGHDAGVRCDASTCTDGDVRLYGGYTDNDGVAEVCIGGAWTAICFDNVTEADVKSFCRQFIGTEPSYLWSSCCSRKKNTRSIKIHPVNNCTKFNVSRPFIEECSFDISIGDSCADLVVGCYRPSDCEHGDVRLRGGESAREGRVEVCNRGEWGTVIQQYNVWDVLSASVVCKQLGYPWEWAIAIEAGIFGRSNTYYGASDFSCIGLETRITDCSHHYFTEFNSNRYDYGYSVGVICQGNTSAPPQCEHGEVHLVGGEKISEGRVEICAYGYWITVCYKDWDTVETDIVCKQLGYPTDSSVFFDRSYFGSNNELPIATISCEPENNNISQCTLNVFNQSGACNHRREIGIICQEREQYFSIKINKYPSQQHYNLGSQVTLYCNVNNHSTHDASEVTYYLWSSALTGVVRTSNSAFTTTIPFYASKSMVYHCQAMNGGRVLGTRRTTLDIKGLLHSTNITRTNIQVHQNDTFHLYIEPMESNILKGLLGLTWYHNGSVIVPNKRYIISNRNKSLTITNFTYSDAGIYKVQFNQLFIHPFNENCKEEALSLLRHLPVLEPAVFCVNMERSCSKELLKSQVRMMSIDNLDSKLKGTLNNVMLKANGRVFTGKELKHSSFQWYRNGQSISTDAFVLQKNYNSLTLNQVFQMSDVDYERSGKYEVLMSINMYDYLHDGSTCQPYYDKFVSPYLHNNHIELARGCIDVDYYKDLTLDLDSDKSTAHQDDGAIITCKASIKFPPFSSISFIKNGVRVATSASGQLQVDTKTVSANPFGLYSCQLNASGVTFNKTISIKEQANIRMTLIDTGHKTVCNDQDKSAIENALVSKISGECDCSFSRSDLRSSSISCKGNIVYTATMEYSSEDGSETASVFAGRIVNQVPFIMSIGGMPVTVTSACSDCLSDSTSDVASLSPADGGGLFIGGFASATMMICIVIIVIMFVWKTRHVKSNVKHSSYQQTQSHDYKETPGSEPVEPVRYIAAEINGGSAGETESTEESRELKDKVSLHDDKKNDYEAMQVEQQDIYEETF